MSVEDGGRPSVLQKVFEGIVVSVIGGLALRFVTLPSSPTDPPAAKTLEVDVAAPMQPALIPGNLPPPALTTNDASTPQTIGPFFPPAPAAELAPALPPPKEIVKSQPTPAPDRLTITAVHPVRSAASSLPAPSTSNDTPAPRMGVSLSVPASIPGPTVVALRPIEKRVSSSKPAGSILLYEDFSRYNEGHKTNWGPNGFVKVGLDHRHWLVSSVDGPHPVGRSIRLPKVFHFECRYAAGTSEITRGILGWWKDPVSTKIAFVNDQGVKYSIEWVIRYGNDTARPNPLGSPSLYAKKYFHSFTLPDGTVNEIGVIQPTGVLRIDRDNDGLKVAINGQSAAVGNVIPMGQLVGFEMDVVKTKNGTVSFTDFKITR